MNILNSAHSNMWFALRDCLNMTSDVEKHVKSQRNRNQKFCGIALSYHISLYKCLSLLNAPPSILWITDCEKKMNFSVYHQQHGQKINGTQYIF